MKNRINIKSLLGIFSLVVIVSCYSDKGNYDYVDVNAFSVSNSDDSLFNVTAKKDVVKIVPKIKAEMFPEEQFPDRYSYIWTIDSKVISTDKNIEYPVDLTVGTYKLLLKVTDKITNLVARGVWTMYVVNLYSKGYVVLSENENNEAQLDMVSTIGKDTMVLLNVTSTSGMPVVKNPRALYMNWVTKDDEIHIIGENRVIKVSRLELLYNPVTGDFRNNFATLENLETFNVTHAANPSYNMTVVMNGDFYQTPTIGGILFDYPMNRYKGKYTPYKIAPQVALNYASAFGKAVLYNLDEKRFTHYAGTSDQYADSIKNTKADIAIFDWMPKLEFFGTYFSYYGTGDSFTILTDGADKFQMFHYRILTVSVTKLGCYDISDAPQIAKAKHFRFSSKQPFFFYAVGTKIYGYDFKKNIPTVEIEMGAEVTCIYEDINPSTKNLEKAKDLIYIATYGGTPGSGKIIKKHIINDPDIIGFEDPVDAAGKSIRTEWTGLNRVIDILYKQ